MGKNPTNQEKGAFNVATCWEVPPTSKSSLCKETLFSWWNAK